LTPLAIHKNQQHPEARIYLTHQAI